MTAALLGVTTMMLWAAAGPAPVLHVQPASARPGDVVLVTVDGAQAQPQGQLAGTPLTFYRYGDHQEALVGLPLEMKPGTVEVKVTLGAADAGTAQLTDYLEVAVPSFPERVLTVAPKFIELPPSAKAKEEEDRLAFAKAWAQPESTRLFTRPFIWPRPEELTAHFGDRRTFNGKLASQHYGDDLEGNMGDPVQASNDGEVVMVRDCFASGKTVVLYHGGGLATAYFHLSAALVKPGDHVRRGQLLGRVGKSGRVTGPHLHFAVHVNGIYVDPGSLLRLKFP